MIENSQMFVFADFLQVFWTFVSAFILNYRNDIYAVFILLLINCSLTNCHNVENGKINSGKLILFILENIHILYVGSTSV